MIIGIISIYAVDHIVPQVKRLAAEVKDIADRAQADIGLDYAYLDDVTFSDWQRYHELDRSTYHRGFP